MKIYMDGYKNTFAAYVATVIARKIIASFVWEILVSKNITELLNKKYTERFFAELFITCTKLVLIIPIDNRQIN